MRNRLKVYDATTRPVLDYYRGESLLAEVEGTGRPEGVEERILKVLDGLVPARARVRAAKHK